MLTHTHTHTHTRTHTETCSHTHTEICNHTHTHTHTHTRTQKHEQACSYPHTMAHRAGTVAEDCNGGGKADRSDNFLLLSISASSPPCDSSLPPTNSPSPGQSPRVPRRGLPAFPLSVNSTFIAARLIGTANILVAKAHRYKTEERVRRSHSFQLFPLCQHAIAPAALTSATTSRAPVMHRIASGVRSYLLNLSGRGNCASQPFPSNGIFSLVAVSSGTSKCAGRFGSYCAVRRSHSKAVRPQLWPPRVRTQDGVRIGAVKTENVTGAVIRPSRAPSPNISKSLKNVLYK